MGHYSEFYEEQAENYAKEKAKALEQNKKDAIKALEELGYRRNQINTLIKEHQARKILDYYKL